MPNPGARVLQIDAIGNAAVHQLTPGAWCKNDSGNSAVGRDSDQWQRLLLGG